MAEIYCLKCKAKRDITDVKPMVMKNGRPAMTGTCPVCNNKVFKIGSADGKKAA